MDQNKQQPVNLAHQQVLIREDGSIDNQKASEWVAAINTFAKVCGRHPSQIVADPQHLRHLAGGASWQMAGLKEAHWKNTLSRLKSALAHNGIDVMRKRSFPLSAAWQSLLVGLNAHDRADISSFAGWCTANKIEPYEVTQAVFAQFHRYCHERDMRLNPQTYWSAARRMWNKLAMAQPALNLPQIELIGSKKWQGLPWNAFGEKLQKQVQGMKDWLAADDDDEEPTEEDYVQYGKGRRHHSRPLSPNTIRVYDYDLKAFAGRLVESGIPILELQCLEDLAKPDHVDRCFRAQLEIAGCKTPVGKIAFRIFAQTNALLAAGRFAKFPEPYMAKLGKWYRKSRTPSNVMSDRKRNNLAKYKGGGVEALLNLPARVTLELLKKPQPNTMDALMMQRALGLEIVARWPVRRDNFASLELNHNMTRTSNGEWHCHIQHHFVKNKVELHRVFKGDTALMIDIYLEKFRPILLGSGTCSKLFLTQFGTPQKGQELALKIKDMIRQYTGLPWHIHLMRSLAGDIYLDAKPGHHVDVQHLLGHKDLDTTVGNYVSKEIEKSYAAYDEILDQRRGTSNLALAVKQKWG